MWTVYILRCADDSLYTGIARNLATRLAQHQGEQAGGAKYTRSRRPVTLAWSRSTKDRSTALQLEAAIKKLSRPKKLLLIAQSEEAVSTTSADKAGIGNGGNAG